MTAGRFAELVERLLAGETVRAGAASHPRLRILGALEARLIRADRLVLAGLEEGVWPGAPVDPFLSRPMRASSACRRRSAASAFPPTTSPRPPARPRWCWCTTERRDGAPAKLSRWIWRLETLARAPALARAGPPRRLARLGAGARRARAIRRARRAAQADPAGGDPAEKLAVTGVERWVRDPYAIYARYILRLRPMDRPDEPVEARARGSAVHSAFERFAMEHPDELPPRRRGDLRRPPDGGARRGGMPAGR